MMNKGELIEQVSRECGITKQATCRIVNSIFDIISKTLASENKVKLVGFGTFSVAQRPPRNVRLPHTGKLKRLPARKAVRFKAGDPLTDNIRSGQ